MTRTVYSCRRCQAQLGVIRRGRVLTLEPAVTVVVSDQCAPESVRVICPVCRAGRTFQGGVVIVPTEITEPARSD